MDYDENQRDCDIMKRFYKFESEFYKKSSDSYIKIQNDSNSNNKQKQGKICMLKKSYPHLKRFKMSKNYRKRILKQRGLLISEILNNENLDHDFTTEEKKCIIRYTRRKVKAVYKHAQSKKTEFCNLKVMSVMSEPNSVSVLITKNSLESNSQWYKRLCKDLTSKFPGKPLRELLMIISSTRNGSDVNATHCKNMDAAWSILKTPNDIKVIFVCSNKIRMDDVLELAESYSNLKGYLAKNLRIQHDEAHNVTSGIPPFRHVIEALLTKPNVLSYTPISASPDTIHDDNNAIWDKEYIEKHAMDYTKFDDSTSDNPNYSSCNDSSIIEYEKMQKSKHWRDYKIEKIPDDIFNEVYPEESKVIEQAKEDVENAEGILNCAKERGTNEREILSLEEKVNDCKDFTRSKERIFEKKKFLDWCPFLQGEKEALNFALNLLNIDSFDDIDNPIREIHMPNKKNLHIISTPLRKGLTHLISLHALKKKYNPIVLAMYGNHGDKYHLFGHNNTNTPETVDTIMGKGEFNDKVCKLLQYLKQKGVNVERPIIFIGNYQATGESLSFVNYEYGTIRTNTRLKSTNAEEDYQEACRSNYMIDKFVANDENWKHPQKFLIGQRAFLNHALTYEKRNDERIHDMKNGEVGILDNDDDNIIIKSDNKEENCDSGTVSIPVKVDILDRDDLCVKELMQIATLSQRNEQTKKKFMSLLYKCINNGVIDIDDPTGKFDFKDYTLNGFRCFGKDNSKEVTKGQWKFTSYQNNYKERTTFMNDRNDHKRFQCEILTSNGMYCIRDANNDVIEKNADNIWWMSYKY
jgi:hypothetical protein